MYTSIHDCTTDFVGDTSPPPYLWVVTKYVGSGIRRVGSKIRSPGAQSYGISDQGQNSYYLVDLRPMEWP